MCNCNVDQVDLLEKINKLAMATKNTQHGKSLKKKKNPREM